MNTVDEPEEFITDMTKGSLEERLNRIGNEVLKFKKDCENYEDPDELVVQENDLKVMKKKRRLERGKALMMKIRRTQSPRRWGSVRDSEKQILIDEK